MKNTEQSKANLNGLAVLAFQLNVALGVSMERESATHEDVAEGTEPKDDKWHCSVFEETAYLASPRL